MSTSPTPAPTEPAPTSVVVQRGLARSRMLARTPPPTGDGVVVSRNVLGTRNGTKPQTGRERKIAGELPEWEPLPPGELVVRRPGS